MKLKFLVIYNADFWFMKKNAHRGNLDCFVGAIFRAMVRENGV